MDENPLHGHTFCLVVTSSTFSTIPFIEPLHPRAIEVENCPWIQGYTCFNLHPKAPLLQHLINFHSRDSAPHLSLHTFDPLFHKTFDTTRPAQEQEAEQSGGHGEPQGGQGQRPHIVTKPSPQNSVGGPGHGGQVHQDHSPSAVLPGAGTRHSAFPASNFCGRLRRMAARRLQGRAWVRGGCFSRRGFSKGLGIEHRLITDGSQ
jgi:hypothetical protein